MSIRIVICDGCGKQADECEKLVEFKASGITVHLCDECIKKALVLIGEDE